MGYLLCIDRYRMKVKNFYINFSLLRRIKLASMRQNVTFIISIIYLTLIYYSVVIFKRSHTMVGACSVSGHSIIVSFLKADFFVHLYIIP